MKSNYTMKGIAHRAVLGILYRYSARLFPLALPLAFSWSVHAAPGDATFITIKEAFRLGDGNRVGKGLESLRGHDLEPWAEYYLLRMRVDEDGAEPALRDFLNRNSGTYLAEKLRADWLKSLGKKHQWDAFRREYSRLLQPDQELVCYAWQDRYGQGDAAVLDEARSAWFAGVELPDSCTPITDALVVDKRLSSDDVWLRMRRLLEAGRMREAQAAGRYLPEAQEPEGKTLNVITDKPLRYLDKFAGPLETNRLAREMVLYAISRAARIDPSDAADRLRKIESRLPAADRAYGWSQIAWQAAKRHMPEALTWYGLAKGTPMTDELLAWQARAALRALDWPGVKRAIEQMPPSLASQPDWIYWLGRAQAAQGKREEAIGLYRRIAGQTTFYGNLANEELGRPVTVPPKAAPITNEELAAAANNPGLKQALALMRLDMRAEGVKQWNWTLRGMEDRQLLAAAELARRNDFLDRSISAADRTRDQHDYSLRYPSPFRDEVDPRARELALDSGWIYGLIRQESRFVMSAKSGVGARGLMQVMPATAKWVAKKIGLVGYHPNQMSDTSTNVALGTNYLKLVLGSLDNHPVLACAAYNAGPGRAQRWRADKPIEGAIYAETIPFTETRDYVKKVMSNSVYYAAMFQDKPQSLKARLGVVQPRNAADTRTEELP
ncbi:MAG TPA: transglycosylase SLT domain-containing protein [Rhodocyclaceae bacterium]|nr:transglycosylase SLT domain-containing protein [Rhodocyclaceae bacterium]